MTDITDDIAEEISFQSFDDDCRLLESLLKDVLQREVGTHFMEKVEKTKVLAQVPSNSSSYMNTLFDLSVFCISDVLCFSFSFIFLSFFEFMISVSGSS